MRYSIFTYIRYLFLFVISVTYYFFIAYYPFAFNLDVGITYHYYLVTSYLFCLSLLLAVSILIRYRFSILEFFLLMLIGAFMILSQGYSVYNNEYICVCFSIIVLFLSFRILNFSLLDKELWWIVLLPFIVECLIGLKQILNGEYVLGTLTNTGVFSSYLVINLPLLFILLFYSQVGINRIFGTIVFSSIFTFVVIVSYINNSRTATLSIIFLIMLVLAFGYNKAIKPYLIDSKRRIWSLIAGACFVVAGMIYLAPDFFLKKQLSAQGRLMKLDICSQHILDNFWFGLGLGKFTYHYPIWQAKYFCTQNNIPRDYFLSADKSCLLFNEYLQLFLEIGVIGFMLSLSILYDFFCCRSKSENYRLMMSVKLVITTILFFALTSYPLYCTFFMFLIALCFSTAYTLNNNGTLFQRPVLNSESSQIIGCSLLVLSIYCTIISFTQIKSITNFNKIYGDYLTDRQIIGKEYLRLYPRLKQDGKFLLAYGEFLVEDSSSVRQGIDILEKSKSYFISYQTFNSTAIAYQTSGNFNKAIENFEFLSCFIPSQFYPKYEIAKIYQETGDTLELRRIGNVILNMPVKIPSLQVDGMKKDIRAMINRLNKKNFIQTQINERIRQ